MAIVFNNLSASGGSKLYRHQIRTDRKVSFEILTYSSEPFSYDTFYQYLVNHNYTKWSSGFNVIGSWSIGSNFFEAPLYMYASSNKIYIRGIKLTFNVTTDSNIGITTNDTTITLSQLTDNVSEV